MVLQQALADLNTAYRNFFASLTGKRKGRKVGAAAVPVRKRDRAQAIRFTKAARFTVIAQRAAAAAGDRGRAGALVARACPAQPSSVTVTVDAAGRYFASFVVDSPTPRSRPTDPEVGIDLGLTHFAVLSDGTKVDSAAASRRKAAASCARAQQELARRQKGSAQPGSARAGRSPAATPGWPTPGGTGSTSCPPRSSARTKRCTSRIWPCPGWPAPGWPEVGARRRDGRRSSACWSTRRAGTGAPSRRVDRWLPSTRTCSVCGAIDEAKPLHVRAWTCPCGAVHDRDVNAATQHPRRGTRGEPKRSWSWCQPGPRSRNRP